MMDRYLGGIEYETYQLKWKGTDGAESFDDIKE